MATVPTNSQSRILDRAFGAQSPKMSVETAKYFLGVTLDPNDEQRANELAALSRQGSLTLEQQAELEEYRRAGRMIELLKLRARAVLNRSA